MDLDNRQVIQRPTQPPARATGIHLSGILRHIVSSSRMPGWQRYLADLNVRTDYPLIWLMGVAWEEMCASLYPGCLWQPGQVIHNGVAMNCDGYSLLDEGTVVDEFKYTSCKRRTGVEFMQDWLKMQQGRGYCGGYGMELVRWHVLWNYRPWAPVYVRYLVAFDSREIADTARMIASNRESAIAAGYGE